MSNNNPTGNMVSPVHVHPSRDEAVKGVVLGQITHANAAALVGVNQSSFTRYFNKHVTDEERYAIRAAARVATVQENVGIVEEEAIDYKRTMNSLLRRVDTMLSEAEQTDQPALALSAARELRKTLMDAARLNGLLKDNVTVEVKLLESREWVAVRSILRELCEQVPEARTPLLQLMRKEKLAVESDVV